MSLCIDVKSDIDKIAKFMDNMEKKQLPFAMRTTLNELALKSQSFIIKRIPTIFSNTRRWYDPRQQTGIKVQFTYGSLVSAVYTKAHFGPIQEAGGIKLPYSGNNIAVPTDNLARQNRTSTYLKALRGDSTVFRLGSSIYRRLSGNRLRRLYTLTPQARVAPRFNFKGMAMHVYNKEFDNMFTKAFNYALRTAR